MIALDDLRASPNALARHYSHFRVSERLLLTGHSHQAWPDVARSGQLEAFDDAARDVDDKWARAVAKADEVRDGFRTLLGDPSAQLVLAASTHELVVRFLSALDLRDRPKLITTDGEFHTIRRQLDRLAEEGVDIVRIHTEPVSTLAERVAAQVDSRTSAVLASVVLFETSRIVVGVGELAAVCAREGVELLVDAYHAIGVVPVNLSTLGLENAWVVGGGYKYLQLGEGNCFLRLPPHADRFRPVVTGWYAEFEALTHDVVSHRVEYPNGAGRYAGSTYDPTSHYRAARVFQFRSELGLSVELMSQAYAHQVGLLARAFDDLDLPSEVVRRDHTTSLDQLGGFLALQCADAAAIQHALSERGVHTDSRGRYLRFGPAPYLSDSQLQAGMSALGEVCARAQH